MELLLHGYITTDYDGHPALSETKDGYRKTSIPTMTPDCNLTIHYTKDICTYEEAQEALLNALYGNMMVHTSYVGYSKYTITGLDLETFTIEGHNLAIELESHKGEYCWIKITD